MRDRTLFVVCISLRYDEYNFISCTRHIMCIIAFEENVQLSKTTAYCAFFSLFVSIIIIIRFKIIDNMNLIAAFKSRVLLAVSKDVRYKAILLTIYRLTATRGNLMCKRKHKAESQCRCSNGLPFVFHTNEHDRILLVWTI